MDPGQVLLDFSCLDKYSGLSLRLTLRVQVKNRDRFIIRRILISIPTFP